MALALAGCVREEVPETPAAEAEGQRVTFDLSLTIPTNNTPDTKAMGYDPSVVSNIYVAVFGSNHYLNEFVKAVPMDGDDLSLNPDGSYNYGAGPTYKVRISLRSSSSTRYVHIMANVPEECTHPDFGYEDEVMSRLYTYGGQDGYWWYKAMTSGISSSTDFGTVRMVRNFAEVYLKVDDSISSEITILGFQLYNTPTRGSFAALKSDGSIFGAWESAGLAATYYTVVGAYPGYLIPGAAPLYRPEYEDSSFPTDYSSVKYRYTYEHPADEANPTYIIAKLRKGGNDRFYRLDILNNNGVKSPLIRNYRYTVTIKSIATNGYEHIVDAEANASDYNYTLTEYQDIADISNYGALMETSYVEKVFAAADDNAVFKYRYTPDYVNHPDVHTSGTVSDINGDGEVTKLGTTGPDDDGWYTVTYKVADPYTFSGDERVSTFSVVAGEGLKLIQRNVKIISMKPKDLVDVSYTGPDGSYDLTLTFKVPAGLSETMFPLMFRFEPHDVTSGMNGEQVISPKGGDLVPCYETSATGSTIYYTLEYFYSEYDPADTNNNVVTVTFQSPRDYKPEIILSDMDGYFLPQDLGAVFVTKINAEPIAKGGNYTTVLEFYSKVASPMTLTLGNLTAVSSSTGTLIGTSYTPSDVGLQQIVVQAQDAVNVGTVKITLQSANSDYPDAEDVSKADTYTVKRYDKYWKGPIVQNGDLPLGTGQTTTFTFNYSAKDMFPVTITATGVDIYSADGLTKLSDVSGKYTYTPSTQGDQIFTIKSKTNFKDAGTISLHVSDDMVDPTPLTVKRPTKIVIPTGKIVLDEAKNFAAPMYWRTNRTYSTSDVVGSSSYFTANSSGDGSNTGNISIDITSFGKEDTTPVYFLYTYTYRLAGIIPLPFTVYKMASATLLDLLNASNGGSDATLTFN